MSTRPTLGPALPVVRSLGLNISNEPNLQSTCTYKWIQQKNTKCYTYMYRSSLLYMHQIVSHKIYKAATISLPKPLKYTLAVSIKDGSNTSVIVLKSALSTFLEMLDGPFKHEVLVTVPSQWRWAQVLQSYTNILTTVHATTKSFVPFCSAQDGESTDMNCLVFYAHCENGKFLLKHQVYNKGIFTNFGYFFKIWNIDIIRMCSWFWVKWCN